MTGHQKDRKYLWAAWEFMIHSVVGTAIFVMIFGCAVLLDLSIQWAEGWGIHAFLCRALEFTKIAVVAIDAPLYLVFILRMAWELVLGLWS